jgi:hypothetical protein
MDSFDLVKIRDIWKRLFGIDVEKKRRVAGLLSAAGHLQQLEKRYPETPLADRLLAEIEAEKTTVNGKTKKRRRLLSQPESKEPGITPGDVFRIFGNGARTILMETDWQGVPETDRRAISEEAALWVYEDGVFRGDGQWRRKTRKGLLKHPEIVSLNLAKKRNRFGLRS